MLEAIGFRRNNRVTATVVALALLLAGPLASSSRSSAAAAANLRDAVSVIVQGLNPFAARDAVESHGGRVTADLSIVDGVEASVPADQVASLERDGRVRAVTPNAPLHFQGITPPHTASDTFNKVTGATRLWGEGVEGAGSTVAIVDTGIQSNVPDLQGRVICGPDFTLELNSCDDSFGHGTFVAGIVAGNGAASLGQYKGMAPRARVLAVKIAGENGASDVAQLLKALQWVVLNKSLYSIDVLNLSVGTDSVQPYALSPLDRAVEEAWKAGIVVVVSASNLGQKGPGSITKPADDPFVITVGAMDDKGSPGRGDDSMAGFSGMGPTAADGIAKPEVVASGRSVVSVRTPGSFIDSHYPSGRVGTAYFKGSGTSFAAATVSGAAALVHAAQPQLNPNQVKSRLMSTAVQVSDGGDNISGTGSIDAYGAARSTSLTEANQGIPFSTGAGSISQDEGSLAVDIHTDVITGLLGMILFDSEWTTDPTGSSWWGSSWWGSSWWGSSWWGSSWWGSSWWGSSWWGSSWWGGWE